MNKSSGVNKTLGVRIRPLIAFIADIRGNSETVIGPAAKTFQAAQPCTYQYTTGHNIREVSSFMYSQAPSPSPLQMQKVIGRWTAVIMTTIGTVSTLHTVFEEASHPVLFVPYTTMETLVHHLGLAAILNPYLELKTTEAVKAHVHELLDNKPGMKQWNNIVRGSELDQAWELIDHPPVQPCTNPYMDIIHAVSQGNLVALDQILWQHPRAVFATVIPPNWTLLHSAVDKMVPIAVIERLLSAGAWHYMDNKDARGETPLHLAARSSQAESLALLLRYGADPNAVDFCGLTPLHVSMSSVDCVMSLVAAGADPNAQDKLGSSPVSVAAESGNIDVLTFLLEHGGEPDLLPNYNQSPFDLRSPLNWS